MPYIESHTSLKDEPKLLDLAEAMAWDTDLALGKLHRFWYWCVDHAESGDLRKYNDGQLGRAVGLNGDSCKRFVDAMVKAGWIDRKPLFRVHDWWHYHGRYLQGKYSKTPDRWRAVQALYQDRPAIEEVKPAPRAGGEGGGLAAGTNRKPAGFPQQDERSGLEKTERPLTAVLSREKVPIAAVPAPRVASAEEIRGDRKDEQLLAMRYPVRCGYHDWPIGDLPPAYCAQTLEQIRTRKLTRIGPEVQRGLQLVVERHLEATRR